MTKSIILLSGLILLASCSLLKPKPLYQPKQLLSIEALDLSEDKSVLSTQNDEILVSIIFGSEIEGTWYANGFSLPLQVFDSSRTLYVPDSIMLNTDVTCQDCEVWICLTEIDDDHSDSATHTRLLELVNTLGYRALDSKTVVDEAFRTESLDNDFLGYVRIPYFVKYIPTSYILTGQDLLDEYAYKVTISSTAFSREE